ncbi:hypothetical protein JYU04_01570 [Dehalococcoides mccartyi]|nr:hypothetical protein [Dehalococcoides mccartyi]
MNTLFLNAVTGESHSFIDELDRQGHDTRIANSFQSAMSELQASTPDFVVIDASLEFASSNALIQISSVFHGTMVAYGRDISPATRQLLMHLGITHVVESVFDLAMLFPNESHAPVSIATQTPTLAIAI